MPSLPSRTPATAVSFDYAQIIDRTSPVPCYFQLSSYIEGKIKGREWQPGQLLPSEQELCQRVGASRTVVRQAISELQRKGLISKQNGKRSNVSFPKYEGGLMQNLRGYYEDAVARGRKPFTKVLASEVIGASGEVAEKLQLKEGEPVIMLNRLRFLDGEPEVLVVTYLPECRCPALLNEDLANESLYALLERKFGLRITQGFRTIEAVSLGRRDAKLLGVKPGSAAQLLKSVGLLEDGYPLEYYIAKHRGDRSKFEVRLIRE